MGGANSRVENEQGLQLCRARKKFIKQALNGRCSLAAAHIAYIEELKTVGAALRRFVEANAHVEALVERSVARLSLPSESQSQHVNVDLLPSSSVVSSQYQSHPMRFTGMVSTKVEEKPSVPVVMSTENPPDNSPWDYFGLFHHVENDYSAEEGRVFDQGSDCSVEIRHQRDEEGMPDLEDVHECLSPQQTESEEEFDEPASASLVRSFRNVNTAPTSKYSSSDGVDEPKVNVRNGDSTVKHPESVVLETKFADGKKDNASASYLSPNSNDVKTKEVGGSEVEDKVAPKDFFSSINDIEQLFVKASESGKEVPKMLEANKFHFRPFFPGRQRRLAAASLLKSCFSCGEDPTEVQQEPSQNSVKYLTWHRTTSFRSSSSRNLLVTNSNDDIADPSKTLFDNFCMVSGSHASTLDRLYAWEKKLYDEVKASEVLRSSFDQKCKILRKRESRGENTEKIRAVVKDLHSRITVAIHRINSISKKIEEIRDMELQPQLEELIEGLRRMWATMVVCHQLQSHIISISISISEAPVKMQSDSERQLTIHLGQNLSSLSSSFTKWISAQTTYIEAIQKWLLKCVSTQKQTSKRNKRMKAPSIRHLGPPIYMICAFWLEEIEALPSKQVADSIKDLAAEVAQFLPLQDKNESMTMLRDDVAPRMDRVRTRLAGFLRNLSGFSERSLKMFNDLHQAIQEAKKNYQQFKSQRGEVFV